VICRKAAEKPMPREKTAGYAEAVRAVKYIAGRWPAVPRVGIVLGSGWGEVLPSLRHARKIPWTSIPGFPRPSVEGHSGALHLGFWGDEPVAVLAGRVHLYEGYGAGEVVFPARVLALAGIRSFVATCAAGGIAPRATPGSLMVFSDHLNFQGANPLAGYHDQRWGERFVDMAQAYDPSLRLHTLKAARALRLRCFEGVYASLPGPTFETPAEIRALRTLGAHAVGMSTVPEVIAVRQMGVRALALAIITNRAAGLGPKPLSHEEVLKTGQAAARDLGRLIDAVMPALGAVVGARNGEVEKSRSRRVHSFMTP
jgi:inosine/guanosine/xanthosine phosphorylase family protein